ncbi:hypothetical protein SCUP234_04053 [Seiridium cupressi]
MELSIFGAVRRDSQSFSPPESPKTDNPLRFGILGAADIAPDAVIFPAKSHPDVVIQAVAARDQEKAKAYAEKHGIPEVKGSYQAEMLDDPKIDCVYIPLPNGLHYEWSLKALKAGKHVLVEKPSFNNTTEAESIYHHSVLSSNGASKPLILLEAVHYIFHPAWAKFMSFVSPQDVVRTKATLLAPATIFNNDNIRFRYELAGGAIMDLGSYTSSALVRIFGGVAEACEEAAFKPTTYDARCDQNYNVKYRFPGGRVGVMEGDLKSPIDQFYPVLDVEHGPVIISSADAGVDVAAGQEVIRTRKVKFTNFVLPHVGHSIQVEDEFAVRKIGEEKAVVKTWKKSETIQTYTFREAEIEQDGEPFWTTYRYQLEQFVNKVRGRETAQWVDGDRTTDTLRMIDMAYTAGKFPLRLTSEYK